MTDRSVAEGGDRRELDAFEFDFGPFGLKGDLTAIGFAIKAVVYEVAVDPHFNFTGEAFDHHGIPFTGWVFGIVGEVEDAALLFGVRAALRGRAAACGHVGGRDIECDAPKVAGVFGLKLCFDRLGKHAGKGSRRGGVNEHPTVTGDADEAVLDLESVV